ncbi:hypothetical protein PFISCL1PPCAC_7065, partial [Pristionchus fissidentatus]
HPIKMKFSLALLVAAAAATVVLVAAGDEKDHIWITKVSAEGKKAVKDIILNETLDPLDKCIEIEKIIQKESDEVQKAYAAAAERLTGKFEEKLKSNVTVSLQQYNEVSGKLSPAAKKAVEEIVAVIKSKGSPLTKAPKIKEVLTKQTPEVKKELISLRDEFFPNADKIKDLILSKLGGH